MAEFDRGVISKEQEVIVKHILYTDWTTNTVSMGELVRCKDCIRFRPDDDVWGWCTVSGKMRCKDYCSYGVRKDGEQEDRWDS